MVHKKIIIQYITEGRLVLPFSIILSLSAIILLLFQQNPLNSKVSYKNKIKIPLESFFYTPPKQVVAQPKTKSQNSSEETSENHGMDVQALKQMYLRSIVATIQQNKRYPEFEQRNNKEGVVKIRMTLLRTGQVASIEIIQASRFSGFNKEAVAAIQRGAPFNKFPDFMTEESITVLFNLFFRLSE